MKRGRDRANYSKSTVKTRTIIAIAAAVTLATSTALADKYADLVKQGYRWVTTDGPFACASKDVLQRIIKDRSDENTLRMVEQGGVYFLIRGAIVQVVQEDKTLGLSQVHWEGIVGNLWTPSTFLSKRPIVNILGSISIPGQPIPGVNFQPGASAIPSPAATATPTHGETAEPEASPTP